MANVPVDTPSAPPERPPQAARALLAASGEPSRKCENPACHRPLTGRAGKRACSARCRAALSRLRQAQARAARVREIQTLLALFAKQVGDLLATL